MRILSTDKDHALSIHEEDSSISSEDNGDPYGRTSHSNSPSGQFAQLRCPLCGNQDFESISSLLDHCKSHAESAPAASSLNCSICSLASLSKETFLVHLASHLPQEHHCVVCGFATKSLARLNAHLAEVHGVDPSDGHNEVSTRHSGGHGKVS